MLLTIDASNEEAMQSLAASLQSISSIGTVVTKVIDLMDTLVGGDALATLEITNVTVTKGLLGLVIECCYPQVDYFYLYVHMGASTPPCCPFDSNNQCCRGVMGRSSKFITASVMDCTAFRSTG